MYRKIGITKGMAIVCFAIWSFGSIEVAAKKTEAATAGAWEEWCEYWRHQGNAPVQMTLTPGKDESELNFSWYSTEDDVRSKIRVADNEQFKDAAYLTVTTKKATKGFYYNHAIVANLKENKTYYYSYMVAGRWTKAYEIQTKDTSNFQFMFVGDVQIGSSYDNIPEGEEEEQGQERAVCNDSFNWNTTLQTAYKHAKNLSFIVTAGDQIQSGNFKNSEANYKTFRKNEIEYAGYLLPELLRKIPVATTIGNHDCLSSNYSYHFNNPNSKMGYGATYAGEDYYFSYGDTMFLMLNTNHENADEHEAFIERALRSNKDARWRIVAMHQDIFGSGKHSNDEEMVSLRKTLLPIFRKYDIDLVLTGHDHTYARAFIANDDTSYVIDSVETLTIMNSTGVVGQKVGKGSAFTCPKKKISMLISNVRGLTIFMNHYAMMERESERIIQLCAKACNGIVRYSSGQGILFLTANSSSGSKYYKLIEKQQDYVEARSQENESSYTVIEVSKERMELNTFFVESGKKVDKTIIITK